MTIAISQLFTRWWRAHVIARLDHVQVLERVQEEAAWTPRYLFMILMSAGIAVLGLLLSSPAVVIGAMLISPLMGPIIGLGFALATVDSRQIRRAALTLAAGSVLAVIFCAAIVLVSPLQNVTPEIAARTRPNLFDLLVALFSALAGSYATIHGRAGTIVGVAIATALMPPLATVGFGLATLNGTVLGGALLLFVTNLVTIALSAAVMARLYGFASTLSPEQSWWQLIAILVTFIGLAVPLGLALKRIAWENVTAREARAAVAAAFPANARVSQFDVDFDEAPIAVSATVLTPIYRKDANRMAASELRRQIKDDVAVTIVQYRVGVADVEGAELKNAAAAAAKQDDGRTAVLDALTVAAGVQPDAILFDRDSRTALVRAAALSGATLATYRALEARVEEAAKDWKILLVPPPLALPGGPLETGSAAIDDAIWAAQRRGDPVQVSGKDSDAVAERFEAAGVATLRGPETGALRLGWGMPDK